MYLYTRLVHIYLNRIFVLLKQTSVYFKLILYDSPCIHLPDPLCLNKYNVLISSCFTVSIFCWFSMPTCTYMYVHVILADIQCLYPYPADPLYLILGKPDILSLFYVSIESLCHRRYPHRVPGTAAGTGSSKYRKVESVKKRYGSLPKNKQWFT